jgi:hypothetical protein
MGGRFYLFGFSSNFGNNYNVTAVLIVLPLLLAVIVYLVNRCKFKS